MMRMQIPLNLPLIRPEEDRPSSRGTKLNGSVPALAGAMRSCSGIGLGFALTAWSSGAGYAILPFQFVWNLIWAPFLGVVTGRALSCTQPIEPSIETSGGGSTVVARDETERLRTRTRWGYGGLAIGIGLGFALTAAQVASAGYAILPFEFLWNLIWAPFLGVVTGRA